METPMLLLVISLIVLYAIIALSIEHKNKQKYRELKSLVLKAININYWEEIKNYDKVIVTNNYFEQQKYDLYRFFVENYTNIEELESEIKWKENIYLSLEKIIKIYKEQKGEPYVLLVKRLIEISKLAERYRVCICYTNKRGEINRKTIIINQEDIDDLTLKILENEVLEKLKISNNYSNIDKIIIVKSHQSLEKYDAIKFFKENENNYELVKKRLEEKNRIIEKIDDFMIDNEYKNHLQYDRLIMKLNRLKRNLRLYRISIQYITNTNNLLDEKQIMISEHHIKEIENNPSLIMTKSEYNKWLKDKEKLELSNKQHEYYTKVNSIVEHTTKKKTTLIIKDSEKKLDELIDRLFSKTINEIQKIKNANSEEWILIGNFISQIEDNINQVISINEEILNYYNSKEFATIKRNCKTLMSGQKEFNDYISEKTDSISNLFGINIVRNETINNDVYNYIRPYKKTINPFAAEVSAMIFASAENAPLEYIVKYFYSNKGDSLEQIQNLYKLIEELETLKEAKQIIENYKLEYKDALATVPRYVLENDEAGFYKRLGFAHIDESTLVVEYKFSYTSAGGFAQRSFSVPMVEDTIIKLIHILESKLSKEYFVKEQRLLMTKKLRDAIKQRDNYTCCNCGNSTHIEPNLLLEIDHIIPVSKGGYTIESNLQTLCWKCNREKSNKILE